MPQRLLRPGLRDSKRWNACDWLAQSAYIRILTSVDDFGRYYGEPEILRGHLFARRPEVTCQQIADICQQLASNGLAMFYVVEGETYIQLTKWTERVRTKSKFPEPPASNLRTIDSRMPQNTASSPSYSPPPAPAPSPSPADDTITAGSLLTPNGKETVELMEDCQRLFGVKEMRLNHSRWYKRSTEEPKKLLRVLLDLKSIMKEGKKINNPAAYAETSWQQFK